MKLLMIFTAIATLLGCSTTPPPNINTRTYDCQTWSIKINEYRINHSVVVHFYNKDRDPEIIYCNNWRYPNEDFRNPRRICRPTCS